MKIKVRNVAGIASAELDLGATVLVGGRNAAGKSSLLQCVAAALLGDPTMRGIAKRTQAAALVRDGAQAGAILLEYDGGAVRIAYPDGKVEQQGAPRVFGSPLALGAARWMALDARTRLAELTERWAIRPTPDDLAAAIRAHQAVAHFPDDAVAALAADVEEKGWDDTAKVWGRRATELTGRWSEATGVRFGERVVETWVPPGLFPGEEYPVEDAEQGVADARRDLAAAQQRAAVTADHRRALEELADGVPAADERLAEAETRVELAAARAEAAAERVPRDRLPDPEAPPPTCPHCGKAVRIVRQSGALFLEKAKPGQALTPEQRRQQQEQHDAALAAHRSALDALRAAQDEAVMAKAAHRAAHDAAAALARIADEPDGDPAEVERAREVLAEKESYRDRVRKLARSKEIAAEWRMTKAVASILAADGVRATVFQRALSMILAKLGEASAAAKMAPVGITDDGALTYGGRAFGLLSESEQWRAEFVMAVVLNRQEKALPLVLLDRLDVLDPPSRPGVFALLQARGMRAVIAMTAAAPDKLPDLARAKMGSAVWMEAGSLKRVPAQAAAA